MDQNLHPLRAFQHQQLDSRHNEIRLLRLLPPLSNEATGNVEPISCVLEHVSLDTVPAYVVISYLWGNPKPSSYLSVNGQLLPITYNLEVALRHLRDILKSSRLWIDAVCINQHDATEKSAQIPHMLAIYEHAENVVSWLGPAADDSDLAMRSMDDMGRSVLSCGPLQEVLAGLHDYKIKQLKTNTTIGQGAEVTIPVSPLVNLFRREFWRRVWIMQEIAMSKVLVFVCGQTSVSWHRFFGASWLLQLLKIPIGSKFEVDWRLLEDAYLHVNFFIGGSYLYKYGYNRTKGKQPLRTLLEVGRQHTRASDPRDMVFAFVGLAGDWEDLGVAIDYSKTFEEIFTNIARAWIKRKDLEFLYHAPDDCLRSLDSLPSWVPDWTRPRSMSPIIRGFCDDRPFSVSGELSHNDSFCRNACKSRVIILNGMKVGEVASVGQIWEAEKQNSYSLASLRWFEELDQLSSSYPYENGPSEEAIWWTPIAFRKPRESVWRGRSDILYQAYQILRGRIQPPEEFRDSETWRLQKSEPYTYAINRTAKGRRAFISDRGQLGLGPSSMQSGDLICILLGIEVPLIFRPVQTSTHILIGDAYVYGIMHGEHMDTNPKVEAFEIE